MQQLLNTAEADKQQTKRVHPKRPCDQTAQETMLGPKYRPEGQSGGA